MIDENSESSRAVYEAIDSCVGASVTHIGFILQSTPGKVLVTEPKGHPYGVASTWCKTRRRDNEKPSQTLLRCLREQIGFLPDSVYPIPYVWATPNSLAMYFTGGIGFADKDFLQSPADDIAKLHWLTVEDARSRFDASANEVSRRRDLGLLDAASGICVSPYRRILLMVRELHQMGYQRMRAVAYVHSVGTWRCSVVPSAWTLRRHGGLLGDLAIPPTSSLSPQQFTYTSATDQLPFGWQSHNGDIVFADPYDLAKRFLQEYPSLAFAGYGPDPDYVQWFVDALIKTTPNGVWYGFADYEPARDTMYTAHTAGNGGNGRGEVLLPKPPPGLQPDE